MAFNKATLFFSDGFFGWSEVYYDAVSADALIDTLKAAVTLMAKRVAMLGQGQGVCVTDACTIPKPIWIRVSVVGAPRQTIFATPNGEVIVGTGAAPGTKWNVGQPGQGDVNSLAPDNPYSAILYTAKSALGYASRRVLSGAPDAAICDGAIDVSSTWYTAFKTFASTLINAKWGVLYSNAKLTPDGNLPANAVALQSITQLPDGTLVFTPLVPLSAGFFPPGACQNYRIGLLCEKSRPCFGSLNGIYRVAPVMNSAGAITSLNSLRAFKPVSIFFAGYIVPYNPQVDAFVQVQVERPEKRDRGIPFVRPRGRARTRR